MTAERYVSDKFSIYDGNKKLNMEEICKKLNEYEKSRKKKNNLIAEYKER